MPSPVPLVLPAADDPRPRVSARSPRSTSAGAVRCSPQCQENERFGSSEAVAQLDREWHVLEHGSVAAALPGWHARQPVLRPHGSPRQLIAFLHSAPAEETDRPLLALLALARDEQLAGRTLLQVLLPALKRLSRRILHPAWQHDEVWELLLFYAWEAISCYPLQRRSKVAANLVLQVLHDTTRELRREQAAARLRSAPASESPEPVLADAVAAGVVSEPDLELILRTRIDGVPLGSLAAAHHIGYGTLRKRRLRAEQAVRAMAGSGPAVPNRPVRDPVSYESPVPLSDQGCVDGTDGSLPAIDRAA